MLKKKCQTEVNIKRQVKFHCLEHQGICNLEDIFL